MVGLDFVIIVKVGKVEKRDHPNSLPRETKLKLAHLDLNLLSEQKVCLNYIKPPTVQW